MVLLQNTVFHVNEFRAVQLQNHTNMAIYPGQGANYYTYLTLLRSAAIGENIEAGGNVYRGISTCDITYKASNGKSVRVKSGALVNCGENGKMPGQDLRITEKSPHQFCQWRCY